MSSDNKGITYIECKRDYNQLCNRNFGKIIGLFFWAEWNDESKELKTLLEEYIESYDLGNCVFGFVNSDKEEISEICTQYNIESVPSCILIDSDKNTQHNFEAMNPGEIFQIIEEQLVLFRNNFEIEKIKMFNKIEQLLKQYSIIVFIKGTEKSPECGFSRKLCELFNKKQIIYKDVNVFEQGYRHWIKEFSGWQTIPQVYMDGKIVGGLDAINNLEAEGKLDEIIPKGCIRDKIEDILEKIIQEGRVIVFKTTDKTNSEFWKRAMAVTRILGENGVMFSMFDEAEKPGIKEELFKKSGQEIIPQLYLDGKFYSAGEELETKLKNDTNKTLFDENLYMKNINDHLKKIISKKHVMIFIKGTPDNPQCGFSNQLCQIFDGLKIDYGHFNIMADPLVREKLKEYSSWNTYPQVYIDNELVGGLDIVKELIENGEFQDMIFEHRLK